VQSVGHRAFQVAGLGGQWQTVLTPTSPSPNGPSGRLLTTAFVLLLVLTGRTAAAGDPRRVAECGPTWSVVASPDGGLTGNSLYSVATNSSGDAWAVGTYFDGDVARSLIEHWDGSAWRVVEHPERGTDSFLLGVASVAADDAWAVGYYHGSDGLQHTFALHWDGLAWAVVPTKDAGLESSLRGVAALAADDVWAVGNSFDPGAGQTVTLVEHWDGSSWTIVPSPNAKDFSSELFSVEAGSPSDVWAVGFFRNAEELDQTLVERWDGSSWALVPSPNVGAVDHQLLGADALSASHAWAVGAVDPFGDSSPVILRWNGVRWKVERSPRPRLASLEAVVALSPTDAWAVGGEGRRTLIERWNGSEWRLVHGPSPGLSSMLHDIAVVGPEEQWAVGSSIDRVGNVHTLTLRRCDRS
jgi:hypothetical protein